MRRMSVVRRGGTILLLGTVASIAPQALAGQEILDLPGRDRALRATVEEVFSVGSILGEEWETFARVAAVAFDEAGNLYILDADNGRVVKVAPDGRLLAELGRKGEGPGEFQMPTGMAVTREGRVAVFDIGHRGFTLFGPDGAFDRTVPLALDMGRGVVSFPTGALHAHPEGEILVGGGSGVVRTSAGLGAASSPPPPGRPILLYSLEDGSGRVIHQAWGPPPPEVRRASSPAGSGGVTFSIGAGSVRAFEPGLSVGLFPDGSVAVVDSTTYRVKILGSDGRMIRILERPVPPREVTRRDQEDERARRLAELEASGGPRIVVRTQEGTSTTRGGDLSEALKQRIEEMEFADVIPVVRDLGVDWEGRVWVARQGPRVGQEGLIDVLAEEGGYLGTLPPGEPALPDAFGPGGLVAYIERDEMDVPRVVVKRIALG